jgi:endonuclease YncB( thermonuclease family)
MRPTRALAALCLAWAALLPADAGGWPQPHCALVPRAQGSRPAFFRPFVVPPAVIRVHDGDTFYAAGEKIRLRGIDTPEVGEPGADAATRRLRQLLGVSAVTIVPRAQDVYCRTVADVYVAGQRVADVLRREGHAKPLPPRSRPRDRTRSGPSLP